MCKVVSCLMLFVLLLAGCTTKSKAQAQAKSAYLAGQLQALQRAQQQQQMPPASQPIAPASSNTVSIVGDVANPVLVWSEGLTLVRAIVAADYRSPQDPSVIFIVRKGQTFKVNPRQLINGLIDPVLEPGDVVELRP